MSEGKLIPRASTELVPSKHTAGDRELSEENRTDDPRAPTREPKRPVIVQEAGPDQHAIVRTVFAYGLGGATALGLGGMYMQQAESTVPVRLLLILLLVVLLAAQVGAIVALIARPRTQSAAEPAWRADPETAWKTVPKTATDPEPIWILARFSALCVTVYLLGSALLLLGDAREFLDSDIPIVILFIFCPILVVSFTVSYVAVSYFREFPSSEPSRAEVIRTRAIGDPSREAPPG